MSSMQRTIRRSIQRKNGTFVAQKPLREKGGLTFMQKFMQVLNYKRALKENMENNKR